jgi:hypothetical protein
VGPSEALIGPTEVGWRIIDVWDSEQEFLRFHVEWLNPALQSALRGAPPPRQPFERYAVNGVEGLTGVQRPD